MNIRRILFLGVSFAILPGVCSAQSFGKVFSTPQERQYLDRERENALRELSEQELLVLLDVPPTVEIIMEQAPRLIHMGGSVRRADGNHTIWLNGVAVSQGDLPANARLEFVRGLGVLHVQGIDREYIMRPGQTLNADTGAIREDYELTAEEREEINAQVAAREAAANPLRSGSADTQQDGREEVTNTQEVNQALIQDIVEGLQLLQQARDIQGDVQ
jgi:hypothetical protein